MRDNQGALVSVKNGRKGTAAIAQLVPDVDSWCIGDAPHLADSIGLLGAN